MKKAILAVLLLLSVLLSSCGEKTEPTETEAYKKEAEHQNILIGGTDRATGLTDLLLLLSVNEQEGKINIMQIPRDTYANYTQSSYKKLNGAYGALGGGGALCDFLSCTLGISIDEYAVISPDTFCAAVDAIGGVEITVDRDMYYKDPYQNLTISLKKGKQTLSGKQAEGYVRYRSGYEDGDLGRLDAQKQFLAALYKKVSEDMGGAKLLRLTTALSEGTDTSLAPLEMVELYSKITKIRSSDIIALTAPGEGAIAKKSGASYYVLSAPSMDEVLSRYFGAKAGSFDREELFLNCNYDSFKRIYREKSTYKPQTLSDLGG